MARGKILRDTNAGDGIIFVGEKQVPFSLENTGAREFRRKQG